MQASGSLTRGRVSSFTGTSRCPVARCACTRLDRLLVLCHDRHSALISCNRSRRAPVRPQQRSHKRSVQVQAGLHHNAWHAPSLVMHRRCWVCCSGHTTFGWLQASSHWKGLSMHFTLAHNRPCGSCCAICAAVAMAVERTDTVCSLRVLFFAAGFAPPTVADTKRKFVEAYRRVRRW